MESRDNQSTGQNISETTIKKIKLAGGMYDPDSALLIDDQLFICEQLASDSSNSLPNKRNENVSVKCSVNDTRRRQVTLKLTKSKQDIIKELKLFNYRTPPIQIAEALQVLFADHPSKEGHWLYVAQNWNPRAINRVIKKMIKSHISGRVTIQNPSAYFTSLIKHYKKRRSL